MIRTVLIPLIAACLALSACSRDNASPAPDQKANVTSTTTPTREPIAETPDGSAANTGNRANGAQAATGRK